MAKIAEYPEIQAIDFDPTDYIVVSDTDDGEKTKKYALQTLMDATVATVPAGVSTIDDLSDVVIASPLDQQILTYFSSSGEWKNATWAFQLGDLTGVTITSPNENDILKYVSGIWQNVASAPANPFDQDLNTTDSPEFSGLDVTGDINYTGDIKRNGNSMFRTVDALTGSTAFTITETYLGKRLVFGASSPIVVTLPQDSTSTVLPGFQCVVRMEGTGTITFAVQGADVLHSPNGLNQITTQYSEVVVTKKTSGVWELNGELA